MLKTRILTALILAAVLLLALFQLPALGWILFCGVLLGLAAWEWCSLAGLSAPVSVIYPLLTTAAFCVLAISSVPTEILAGVLFGASLFWLMLAPLWLRNKWRLRSAGYLNLLLGWALLLPAGIALLVLRGNGWLLLGVMLVAWIADTAAYFSGKMFGRHKLAPTISPGKTWEGAVGAVLFVMLYVWLVPKPFEFSGIATLMIGVLLTAVSIVGDLLESLFKRQAGMKDSSHLLPGHGGVLDRVDSLLSLLPVAASIYLGYPLFF